MKSRRIWFSLVLLTIATIVLLWGTSIPLGISREWVWQRLQFDDVELPSLLLGCLVAAACVGMYVAFMRLGAKRLCFCSRQETAVWLVTFVVAAFYWLMVVQAPPPFDSPMAKAAWVPYYPKFSGYFTVARHDMPDVKAFLGTYEERMAEGDVLHIGTHPPGLFLFHRGLLEMCRTSPALTRFLLATQPEVVRTAFRVTSDFHKHRWGLPLAKEDRAAVWLSSLVTQLAAALTVIPLFLLLRRDYSRAVSWMAVSFWPFIPAVGIFLPKSDVLYPFLGMAFLYVWLEGNRRRSAAWCVVAGLLFWLGLFFSLALLPVGLLAILLTFWNSLDLFKENFQQALRKIATLAAWAAVGFGGMIVAFWLVVDLNLWQVWSWNYQNHAAFYDQSPRTYWKWFLVNPLELTFAVGVPVVVLAVLSYCSIFRNTKKASSSKHILGEPAYGPFVCCAVVWGLVWLSGKNQGEAGRLWIVFMPWLVWLSAEVFQRATETSSSQDDEHPKDLQRRSALSIARIMPVWLIFLLLQAVVCIATVLRVDGFELHHSSPQLQQANTSSSQNGSGD